MATKPTTPPAEAEARAADQFTRLVRIMRTLRSPDGCPWDQKQTLKSLTPFVLEEAYEVVDAIEKDDAGAVTEEVGDLIFEGVFLAQVTSDEGGSTVADSLQYVCDKLVRRHPHVFRPDGSVHDADSKARAPSAEAALGRWEELKAQERQMAGRVRDSLAEVPAALPALLRAYKLGQRAGGVGFDWPRATDVLAKLEEETRELRTALQRAAADARTERAEPGGTSEASAQIEEEMGDVLFTLANLSRKLGIEPEAALRRANEKFSRRFGRMERELSAQGQPLEELSLDALEAAWQRAKAHDDRSG